MNRFLSDNDITLLSAYHDGELAGADLIRAEELLEQSPEARTWLRDTGRVGRLSVAASSVALSGDRSAKLSGAAIAAAAERRSFSSLFSSTRGNIAAATAALVVGAVFVVGSLGGPEGDATNPTLSTGSGTTAPFEVTDKPLIADSVPKEQAPVAGLPIPEHLKAREPGSRVMPMTAKDRPSVNAAVGPRKAASADASSNVNTTVNATKESSQDAVVLSPEEQAYLSLLSTHEVNVNLLGGDGRASTITIQLNGSTYLHDTLNEESMGRAIQIGAQIGDLVKRLNSHVAHEITDTSRSARERVLKVMRLRLDFDKSVRELIERRINDTTRTYNYHDEGVFIEPERLNSSDKPVEAPIESSYLPGDDAIKKVG